MPTFVAAPVVPIFRDGTWITPNAADFMPVHNPSTGEVIARTPVLDAAQVDAVVEGAAKAFATWSKTSYTKRVGILFKPAHYIVLIQRKRNLRFKRHALQLTTCDKKVRELRATRRRQRSPSLRISTAGCRLPLLPRAFVRQPPICYAFLRKNRPARRHASPCYAQVFSRKSPDSTRWGNVSPGRTQSLGESTRQGRGRITEGNVHAHGRQTGSLEDRKRAGGDQTGAFPGF